MSRFVGCLLLAYTVVVSRADMCSHFESCSSTVLNPLCGWCWDDEATSGQKHGGRFGGPTGPEKDDCYDWTFFSFDCHKHTDCVALPDCDNILGTSCGWCDAPAQGISRGFPGTSDGPAKPYSCPTGNGSRWVYNHAQCRKERGPHGIRTSLAPGTDSLVVTFSAWDDGPAYVSFFGPLNSSASTPPPEVERVPAVMTRFTYFNSAGMSNVFRAVVQPSTDRRRRESGADGLVPGRVYRYVVTQLPPLGAASAANAVSSRPFDITMPLGMSATMPVPLRPLPQPIPPSPPDRAPLRRGAVDVVGIVARASAMSQPLPRLVIPPAVEGGVSGFPFRMLVWGDMGRHGGAFALEPLVHEVTQGPYGGSYDGCPPATSVVPTQALLGTQRVGSASYYDAALHIGDYAYDLHDADGLNGDAFFARLENVSARLPVMGCIGNHENKHNATHYEAKFTTPASVFFHGAVPGGPAGAGSGDDQPHPIAAQWYSWDVAGVAHFVAWSSEIYFSHPFAIPQHEAWLREDLARVNRSVTPWVVAYGHRPMYCSNADGADCRKQGHIRGALERLLHEGGVDFLLMGHQHSYERLWPMAGGRLLSKSYTNPPAMVQIISGFAGCNEVDGMCIDPILTPGGDWSAHRTSAPGMYSYGRLVLLNATHATWASVLAEDHSVEDAITVVVEQHGPRSWPTA
eukprot:TRINITY_DN44641_c0_g1_i1.p1 TRINITY_DN44641_c0_g1~~TRINITY_DN44641_c0_g1_i1.p1  ORF type:complete len:685 (+),score=80.08 TRINITY_DN44641_c0_g1_i1:120-2174(+)